MDVVAILGPGPPLRDQDPEQLEIETDKGTALLHRVESDAAAMTALGGLVWRGRNRGGPGHPVPRIIWARS